MVTFLNARHSTVPIILTADVHKAAFEAWTFSDAIDSSCAFYGSQSLHTVGDGDAIEGSPFTVTADGTHAAATVSVDVSAFEGDSATKAVFVMTPSTYCHTAVCTRDIQCARVFCSTAYGQCLAEIVHHDAGISVLGSQRVRRMVFRYDDGITFTLDSIILTIDCNSVEQQCAVVANDDMIGRCLAGACHNPVLFARDHHLSLAYVGNSKFILIEI